MSRVAWKCFRVGSISRWRVWSAPSMSKTLKITISNLYRVTCLKVKMHLTYLNVLQGFAYFISVAPKISTCFPDRPALPAPCSSSTLPDQSHPLGAKKNHACNPIRISIQNHDEFRQRTLPNLPKGRELVNIYWDEHDCDARDLLIYRANAAGCVIFLCTAQKTQ